MCSSSWRKCNRLNLLDRLTVAFYSEELVNLIDLTNWFRIIVQLINMGIIFLVVGEDVILYIGFIRLVRWFFYTEETIHLIDLI